MGLWNVVSDQVFRRRPIRRVRGASSGSDRQATNILVSIDADAASQPIVRIVGMRVRTVLRILTDGGVGVCV